MRVTPADSRDDIQAAIDALAEEGGGTLRFSAGTYEIDAALVWRAGVDLRGEGYATRLLATDATNVVESRYDEETAEGDLSDATIADLRIDGNRHEVPDGADPEGDYPDTHSTSGLWIPFAERVTVRNLFVEHCHGHGIHPDAVVDATITNNVVRDCLIGFHVATRMGYQYGPVRTVAAGNHVVDCRLNGIDFGSQARDCVAAHNAVENCAHGGHGEEAEQPPGDEFLEARVFESEDEQRGNADGDADVGDLPPDHHGSGVDGRPREEGSEQPDRDRSHVDHERDGAGFRAAAPGHRADGEGNEDGDDERRPVRKRRNHRQGSR